MTPEDKKLVSVERSDSAENENENVQIEKVSEGKPDSLKSGKNSPNEEEDLKEV